MTNQNRLAWAYLARVVEGPNPDLNLTLGKYGPEETADRVKNRDPALPVGLLRASESRYQSDLSQQDLDTAAHHGFRLVTAEDPEWPTDNTEPFYCSTAPGGEAAAPRSLWVRGAQLPGLLAESTAVVGTRAATDYGLRTTSRFCAGLVKSGMTIVSGGALGIDTAAHRTAVESEGRTVVFMASGAGEWYPTRNQSLFTRIAEHGGALVSEYPPGTRPARHRFLTRNRLVAGMTSATVIMEAGWRSGARNTIGWANHMNRPIGAVPGPVTSASSTGCHAAIREGGAVLVTCPDDVLALARGIGQADEETQLEMEWAANPVQKLSRNELRLYDSVPDQRSASATDIAEEAGTTLALAVHLLGVLTERGLVSREGSRWIRAGQGDT